MRRPMAPGDRLARSASGPGHPAGDAVDVRERTFHVMGSTARIVVVDGHAGDLHRADARLRRLEARWSRFVSESDLSRLNHAEGHPVPVAPETLVLLHQLVAAWRATAGAFDPTLLPALVATGDAASRDDPAARTTLPPSARWPGDPDGITIDHDRRSARLPVGTTVDAGGLGKGLAADLVVADLLAEGAAGALVSIGGDLRVAGRAPAGSWTIAVEDPADPTRLRARLGLADGGVATSTPAARRWRQGTETRHHLLDPRRGASSDASVASVTVAAGTAAWAEAFTKVPFAVGPVEGTVVLDDAGIAALIVRTDGTSAATRAWAALAGPHQDAG
jgi:FAD:protein FMN transferase